jgi:hypothetical protein
MARCIRCGTSGGNMKKCKDCGFVYCRRCDGGGHSNVCPRCGSTKTGRARVFFMRAANFVSGIFR